MSTDQLNGDLALAPEICRPWPELRKLPGGLPSVPLFDDSHGGHLKYYVVETVLCLDDWRRTVNSAAMITSAVNSGTAE